jgi:hypothetical protein
LIGWHDFLGDERKKREWKKEKVVKALPSILLYHMLDNWKDLGRPFQINHGWLCYAIKRGYTRC